MIPHLPFTGWPLGIGVGIGIGIGMVVGDPDSDTDPDPALPSSVPSRELAAHETVRLQAVRLSDYRLLDLGPKPITLPPGRLTAQQPNSLTACRSPRLRVRLSLA
jgi:hypothetical protein